MLATSARKFAVRQCQRRHGGGVGGGVLEVRRRWLAAAATSRQKRALNKDQLKGESSTAVSGSDTSKSTTPTSSSSSTASAPPSGGGGAGSKLLPIGVGLAGLAGIAYYNMAPGSAPVAKEESVPSDTEQQPAAEPDAKKQADSDGPHRVVSIQVPSKMKGSSSGSKPPAIPTHPEGGNRVGVKPKAPELVVVNVDPVMTEEAIAALKESTAKRASEAVVESHVSLWSSMDESFFADLDSLNSSQLKARIVQLVTEMKDRTKWEAVRLKEFLAMKEKETADM